MASQHCSSTARKDIKPEKEHYTFFPAGCGDTTSTTCVRKTWDLEWEAENDVKRNNVSQMYLKINDLSSIKFPN